MRVKSMDKVKLVVIAHTHWDREWYYTFDKYRLRLVRCIDKALALFREKPGFHSFMLDGQVAPVDDYLEIRPEKREELIRRVKERRLIIGPWYIQPDEFLVNEESLVRNLMLGIREAQRYGGCMKIGYLPDTFGHTVQLPQILRGFGIDVFVFHRGLGPAFEELGTPFIWQAPDGSSVIALFLYGGYCNLMKIPPDPDKAVEHVKALYERWKNYLRISVMPGMVGCDHHLPRDYLPEVISELKSRSDLPVEIKMGTLEEVAEAARKESGNLKTYSGELLSSHYHVVLYGTWSSRVYLKQLNFESEVLLTYFVEPLWTIAWILGAKHPREFIWRAWKYLILSQPHDSICGCSTDEVHKECEARLLKAKTLAEELLQCTGRDFGILGCYVKYCAGFDQEWHALTYINSKIDLSFEEDANFYVVAYNTLPWKRRSVIKLKIRPYEVDEEFVDALMRIAPEGYEITRKMVKEKGLIRIDFQDVMLKDSKGNVIPCQYRVLPDETVELSWIDELPAMGYKAYAVLARSSMSMESDIRWGNDFIENEYFKVEFDLERGGALRIIDKRSGEVYEGLNVIEDNGDKGDGYDYSPPDVDEVIKSDACKASLEIVEKGPVLVTAKVSLSMKVPVSLTPDRKRRSESRVNLPVTFYVTLYSKVPRVDVRTVVFNVAKDHRLRVVFPTGVNTPKHWVKTHYCVLERPNKTPHYYIRPDGTKAPVETYPMRLWVDVNDGRRGLCIAARGLHEYEVRDGEKGSEIAITLMRCVGWLSKPDLLTRPVGAGPEIATPDAQCFGERVFEYSIIPHTGSWHESRIHKLAQEYAVYPIAHEDLPHRGELPTEKSFLEVEGDPLIVSTFKKSEEGEDVVVRLYNPSSKYVRATLKLYKAPGEVWLSNLNEEKVTKLEVSGEKFEVELSPYKIVTLRVRF